MTKKQLREELRKATLSQEEIKKSVLRMLLSEVGYYEIQKGGAGYEASEEDVLAVLQKAAKQRKESIEQFRLAGRQDLVDKESKELEIINNYLPAQMNEEEIRSLVKEAISQTGAKTMQDIGKVMGVLMPKVKGNADGSLISKIVRQYLEQG